MELSKEYKDLDLTVFISGQVDTNTAPDLEKMISKEFGRAKDITLDFKNVDYISSAGLRVLLSVFKKQNERKNKLTLVNVSEDIMSILDMTGFTSFLVIK